MQYKYFELEQIKENNRNRKKLLIGIIQIIMESKEGSVKKLIRIHLNANKKAFQKRKIPSISSKSITNLQSQKISFKSPQTKISTDKQKSHKYINLQTSDTRMNLPALNTANFDNYGYKSNKLLLEINAKAKSSSEITGLVTPREIVNKLKRIKSEQSMLTTQKHDFLRKLSSKCKVYVKNPFHRKLSKNLENKQLAESKIVDNQSSLSQSGCQELSKIIAFL